MILLPKGGKPSKPENYRLIAKTTTIAKLFNKILARRLESYLNNNEIINATIQKGLLTGSNGLIEHIFAVQAILDNANQQQQNLFMTLIDLKNAFGSVSHSLISLMLHYIKLPSNVSTYFRSTYSELTASISTRNWCTDPFPITQGIFQGDILSPLIFLICFNPIINLAKSLSTGYRLQIPLSGKVPQTGKFIYLKCNEPQSTEPSGWYLCRVSEHLSEGLSEACYRGDTDEHVELSTITWAYAKGNCYNKHYLPLVKSPPQKSLMKVNLVASPIHTRPKNLLTT